MTLTTTFTKTRTKQAIVLGARDGNIGGACAENLNEFGWLTTADDCHGGDGIYVPPNTSDLRHYDACIITVGVTHREPFEEQTEAKVHRVLYGSLELPLLCAQRYVRARRQFQSHGVIVFIGSYAHNHPFTHCTTYCAAKAGLDMAAKSLAWELMPKGFRVHIVHPHHVQGTPMSEQIQKDMMDGLDTDERGADEYARKDLRMPDLLKPSEVAEVVTWLVRNPTAAWTSGTSIEMYGGVR